MTQQPPSSLTAPLGGSTAPGSTSPLRGVVLCDFVEERWPSMDLVAAMLLEHGNALGPDMRLDRFCPPMNLRLSRLPGLAHRAVSFNADRLINRFGDYPRQLRAIREDYDFFHIADHSYAHLALELPPEKTGVYCHDLDTFRCLLQPHLEPRPAWFRRMAQRTLEGLQSAAVVFYSTETVRQQIMSFGLLDPAKLRQAELGVAADFAPHPHGIALDPAFAGSPYLLHVGSCIPRKRIDVLLDIFAACRQRHPGLRLIKVGGEWSPEHQSFIRAHGLRDGITHVTQFIDQAQLAALYRHAGFVLLPSEAEGFGLPLAEALACGAPVIASDIPVFREVGGTAATYCPVADSRAWADTIDRLLAGSQTPPPASLRLEQASRYSWPRHARTMLDAYRRLCESNRKPRVLHVGKFYPPYRGGMESHLEDLSGKIKNEVDLQVVVANTSRQTVSAYENGVHVTRLGRWAHLAATSLCPGMPAAIYRSNADIVHLHWPNPAAVLAYLISGSRAPLVITYHSDVIRQRNLFKLFHPILQMLLQRSQVLITTSPGYAASSPVIQRWLSRCRTVPLGVDPDRFAQAPAAEVQTLRDTYGSRLIFAVGRMVYYKGFEHLISAMQHVQGTLLLAGAGPLRPSLEALAGRLQVADRVRFVGPVPDVRPYYHACDVFVLPSIERTEAFGIVQVEAMACGKPVVNTQLDSGVPFVSLHGVTGLTVPPADPQQLATAIQTLLDDHELRLRLGTAARQRAQQEFSLDKMAADTLEIYRTLLPQPALPNVPTKSGS